MSFEKLTGGSHELQERFAKTIIKLKRKQNVVRNFFGRDYMGDPRSGSVQIPMRPLEVEVQGYDVLTGATIKQSKTEYKRILVENERAINELIDGYEAAAVPDNVIAQRLDSGGYSLGRAQELDAIGVLEDGGTQSPELAPLDEDNAYETIVRDIARIKKLGVNKDELVIVVSDDTETTLLLDKRYANTASQLAAEMLREGITGKINGVPVVVSSNLRDDHFVTEYIVFGRSWAQTIEDWKIMPAINNIYNGTHIGASILQGRIVDQDVLLDPLTCIVKRTLANVPEATVAATLVHNNDHQFTYVATYTGAAGANDDWCVDGIIDVEPALPAGTHLNVGGGTARVYTTAVSRIWLSDIVESTASGTARPKLNIHDSPQTIVINVHRLPSAWKGKMTVKTVTSNPAETEGTYNLEEGKAWTYWHTLATNQLYTEVDAKTS